VIANDPYAVDRKAMADASTLQFTIGKADHAMDWLQWSSSIIGSLAWPVAFVVFCLLFRRPITKLIGKLKKASFAGGAIETTLDDSEIRMEAVEAAAPPDKWEQAGAKGMALDQLPPSLSPEVQMKHANQRVRAIDAIKVDPAEGIEEIWRQVETAVRETARRLGAPADQVNKPIFVLGKHMKGQELFTTQIMVMLAELRKVRNLAVHNEEDVTSEAAQRYFRLAVRLITLLEVL